MVRHEAVSEDSGAVVRGMPAQEFQIETAVIGGMENRLAVVSALGEVVGDAGNDDARTAGHIQEKLETRSRVLRENASVPFLIANQ
jgi:hypothetical protein